MQILFKKVGHKIGARETHEKQEKCFPDKPLKSRDNGTGELYPLTKCLNRGLR